VLQNITLLDFFILLCLLKIIWLVLFYYSNFFYIYLLLLFCWKNISYLFDCSYILYGLWNNSLWKVEYGIMFLTNCGNINDCYQRIWAWTELKPHVKNFVTSSLSPYVQEYNATQIILVDNKKARYEWLTWCIEAVMDIAVMQTHGHRLKGRHWMKGFCV
jgi:hypothetical protein